MADLPPGALPLAEDPRFRPIAGPALGRPASAKTRAIQALRSAEDETSVLVWERKIGSAKVWVGIAAVEALEKIAKALEGKR